MFAKCTSVFAALVLLFVLQVIALPAPLAIHRLLERGPEPNINNLHKRDVNKLAEQVPTKSDKGTLSLYRRDINELAEQIPTKSDKGTLSVYKREA